MAQSNEGKQEIAPEVSVTIKHLEKAKKRIEAQCRDIVEEYSHLFFTIAELWKEYQRLSGCFQCLTKIKDAELKNLIQKALQLIEIYYTCIREECDPHLEELRYDGNHTSAAASHGSGETRN